MLNKVSVPPVTARSVTNHRVTSITPRSGYARYFFVAMACVFPILAVIGFTPSYQAMHTGELKPHWFVHVHGALMSGWLLVFLAQALLAAKGQLRFHRQLGLFSVVLGGLVWISMGVASVRVLIANHPPVDDFLFDLLLMEFYALASFGLFFTWGILARKKDTAAHKRLLFLATLVLLQAAIDRIHWLPLLGIGYPYVFFLYLDALLIPLFIYDFLTLRRIHRITWIGSAFIMVAQLTVTALWGSPAWHQFWFKLSAPLMEKVIEIKLNDAQTDPLLGEYKDKTAGKVTVSREDGKLYIQVTGQGKQEMGATSETELFLKTVNVQFSFVKGADGTVTKAIGHQGGRTWEWPSMKQP